MRGRKLGLLCCLLLASACVVTAPRTQLRSVEGSLLLYDEGLQVYRVRSHADLFYDRHFFYRLDRGTWLRSPAVAGPWQRIQVAAVPPRLASRIAIGREVRAAADDDRARARREIEEAKRREELHRRAVARQRAEAQRREEVRHEEARERAEADDRARERQRRISEERRAEAQEARQRGVDQTTRRGDPLPRPQDPRRRQPPADEPRSHDAKR